MNFDLTLEEVAFPENEGRDYEFIPICVSTGTYGNGAGATWLLWSAELPDWPELGPLAGLDICKHPNADIQAFANRLASVAEDLETDRCECVENGGKYGPSEQEALGRAKLGKLIAQEWEFYLATSEWKKAAAE